MGTLGAPPSGVPAQRQPRPGAPWLSCGPCALTSRKAAGPSNGSRVASACRRRGSGCGGSSDVPQVDSHPNSSSGLAGPWDLLPCSPGGLSSALSVCVCVGVQPSPRGQEVACPHSPHIRTGATPRERPRRVNWRMPFHSLCAPPALSLSGTPCRTVWSLVKASKRDSWSHNDHKNPLERALT